VGEEVAVIACSALCVLGIITVPQYVHFMEGAIVGAVLSCVLLTIIGGFISVLWSNS
jgi:hypothetical protein